MMVAQQIWKDLRCGCRSCGRWCGHTKRAPMRLRVGQTVGAPYQGRGGERVRVRWGDGQMGAPLVASLFPMEGWP